MDSTAESSDIILHDLSPMLRIYKDGRVERLTELTTVPPSLDPTTGVESKDVTVNTETGVSVRIFKPSLVEESKTKVPVLVFFHGGGFCIDSPFSPLYHNYHNSLAAQAQVLIVSVDYRLAPEHLLPIAYDDCWDALNWVFSHTTVDSSSNKEPWLLENADFSRIFLAGDSAGANIAHHIAIRVGNQGLANGSVHHINGIILFHSYFWGKDRIGEEATKLSVYPYPDLADQVWAVFCPTSSGIEDPWINPANEPTMSALGCKRVLIFVAEKDIFRDRGFYYKEVLEKSGWQGKAEVVESLGKDHGFHLYDTTCANALAVMTKVVDFLNISATSTEI